MVLKALLGSLSLVLAWGASALQVRSSVVYPDINFPDAAAESWYVWEAEKNVASSRLYFPFQMVHLRDTDPHSCRYAARNYVNISFDAEGSKALIQQYPGAHWAMILRQNVAAYGPPGYGGHTRVAAGTGSGIAVGRWGSNHHDWMKEDGTAKFADAGNQWWGPVVEWFTKPENGAVLDPQSQLLDFYKGAPSETVPNRTRHYVTSYHVADYSQFGWQGPNLVAQAAEAWSGLAWNSLSGRYAEGPIQLSYDPYPYQYGGDASFAVIFYDSEKFNNLSPPTPLRFFNIKIEWAC